MLNVKEIISKGETNEKEGTVREVSLLVEGDFKSADYVIGPLWMPIRKRLPGSAVVLVPKIVMVKEDSEEPGEGVLHTRFDFVVTDNFSDKWLEGIRVAMEKALRNGCEPENLGRVMLSSIHKPNAKLIAKYMAFDVDDGHVVLWFYKDGLIDRALDISLKAFTDNLVWAFEGDTPEQFAMLAVAPFLSGALESRLSATIDRKFKNFKRMPSEAHLDELVGAITRFATLHVATLDDGQDATMLAVSRFLGLFANQTAIRLPSFHRVWSKIEASLLNGAVAGPSHRLLAECL